MDPTLRLMLLGEQAARWVAGLALVGVTIGLCAVALLGPEALLAARGAEGVSGMVAQLRQALSAFAAVFG